MLYINKKKKPWTQFRVQGLAISFLYLILNSPLKMKKTILQSAYLSFVNYSVNKNCPTKSVLFPKIFFALIFDVQKCNSLMNQHILLFEGANPLIYKDFQQKRPRVTDTLGLGADIQKTITATFNCNVLKNAIHIRLRNICYQFLLPSLQRTFTASNLCVSSTQ